MGFDVNQLYAEICGDDVFFAYAGNIVSEQINLILEEIEEKFIEVSTNIKVRKKIYNIMVESLQNLFHHLDDVPEGLSETLGKRYGMIVIKRKGDDFRLTVGNFVSADKVKFLTEKIEKINSLSNDELKEMYKFILNYQKLSSKGGGGLGLIDIARKSDKKLEYRFFPYNDCYYFYKLDIFVSI
ncbi:MAG: SiaB family protein kinase [Bacteroidales bacterium]|jgi:hypothetical protein|nr:SiaB family protein kinase [Bacteroidales bacterium]